MWGGSAPPVVNPVLEEHAYRIMEQHGGMPPNWHVRTIRVNSHARLDRFKYILLPNSCPGEQI
eukprot:6459076-Prorocentrum_lima.AAC.1